MYCDSDYDNTPDGVQPVARLLRKYIEPMFKVGLSLFIW